MDIKIYQLKKKDIPAQNNKRKKKSNSPLTLLFGPLVMTELGFNDCSENVLHFTIV